MEKRRFGKTGLELGILGFGAMRLPGFRTGKFDEHMDGAVELLIKGIEGGINYIDTAAIYDGGMSETAVGKALKGRRDQVAVSTKILPSTMESADKFESMFEASMKRLDISCLDVFYFHGLGLQEIAAPLTEKKILERVQKFRDQGVIKNLGFSSHDKPERVIEMIETGMFDCMLVQYNYIDTSYAGPMARAHEADMGVAVMGPVGGGRLSGMGPEFNRLIPESLGKAPELALRFAWSNPHLAVALSGMDSQEVLDANLAMANSFSPLDDAGSEGVKKLQEAFDELKSIYCTGCGYCMPCEQGVKISDIFYLLICHKVLGAPHYARFRYNFTIRNHKADLCIECGECEPKCPQKIAIIEQLKEAHSLLGK